MKNNVYYMNDYREIKRCESIPPTLNICPDFFKALCAPHPETKTRYLKIVK